MASFEFAHAPPALPRRAPGARPERVALLAPGLLGGAGGPPTPSVTPMPISHAPYSPPHALEIGPDLGPALEVAAPEGWRHPLQLPQLISECPTSGPPLCRLTLNLFALVDAGDASCLISSSSSSSAPASAR
jgi:hypothetical protein